MSFENAADALRARRPVLEIFLTFLRLGLSSFGGPIAHLGYFHREFVKRKRWLDEAGYARILAPCQFLPGPASSQFGFSVGLQRAGWRGGLAAFCAFTLPSALLMLGFAAYRTSFDGARGQALLHGLKLVAVAVVAQGLLAMARTLTPDWPRRLIAVLAAAAMLSLAAPWMQFAVIVLGAALGTRLQVAAQPGNPLPLNYGRRTGGILLGAFGVLLLASWLIPPTAPLLLRAAGAFYRAGALVFGGGHVVLPLLREAVVAPGWLSDDDFLAGYGAAQAMPGPMFSVASFLGAHLQQPYGEICGALTATLAIFLPGLLLIAGALPYWGRLAANPRVARALAGVNAAVVGLIAAALYDPLWSTSVKSLADFLIALAGFLLLAVARAPVLLVVVFCVAAEVVWPVIA